MLKILPLYFLILSSVFADNIAKKSSLSPNYSFIDTSINYLDWSSSTQNNTAQKDFTYLELEGGAGWNWGEFYGFLDIENPTHSYYDTPSNDLRIALKPIVDIYIYNSFAVHIQDYYLHSNTFYVSNLVTGFSYKFKTEYGLWFTPFLGAHYQSSTYYSGFNGYIGGWTFNYNFSLFDEKFTLFNWNEIEFARDKEGYILEDGTLIGDAKEYGFNGALSFWWGVTTEISTGLQYRYAKYKLGSPEYQSGVIYSLKYYY
jgi:hypothetical protein